jgi:hypothetical protein
VTRHLPAARQDTDGSGNNVDVRAQAGPSATAWHATLDALEADVAHAERLATGARMNPAAEPAPGDRPHVRAWTPAVDAPLPPELVERARALLDRQIAAAASLARGIALSRRHAAYAARVNAIQDGSEPPAFVDEGA